MNDSNTPRQAIALKYDGQHAPTLTGKGDAELAEAILKLAREHEVPIYENAELVRLLARMELGDSIPEELYRTIAEIGGWSRMSADERRLLMAELPARAKTMTKRRGGRMGRGTA